MKRLSETERTVVLRIIDANANRCAEGLRVVEEIARFSDREPHLLSRIKEMRHAVRRGVAAFAAGPERFRDSEGDIGREGATPSESARGSLGDVARANFARAEEALRVIEEFGKLVDAAAALHFKRLRFELYALERAFVLGGAAGAKLPRPPFLYAIIDRSVLSAAAVPAAAEALVGGGVDIVQYRAKGVPLDERRSDLVSIIGAARRRDVPVIVNDEPLLALETGADGVHLGARDAEAREARITLGPDRIIGMTIHSAEELGRAPLPVVDYVAVGSIFPSPTKPDVPVVGLDFLERVKRAVSCPLVAIGGIDERTIGQVLDRGADGVALVSALLTGDIGKNCFTFASIIDTRRAAAD